MNRVLAVAVTAATATMFATAAIVPAMAAQRPARARTAATATATATAKKSAAKTAAQHAAASALAPLLVTSQLGNGQYVTVVQCHGSLKNPPPPVEVGQPDAPLTVHGSSLSSGMLATLEKPNSYKAVYACTVVVKERVQPKPKPKPRVAGHHGCVVASGRGTAGGKRGNRCKKVTLNTGFGGLAGQVSQHHPAG